MTERLLVTGALLVDVGDDVRVRPDSWLLVEDGVVAASGSGDTHPWSLTGDTVTERLDVGGAFVAPGFVSSHSHLFTSVARGVGVDQTLYGWADAMYGVTREAGADDVYWSTVHGALGNLDNGVTTIFDFLDPRTTWTSMRERSEGRRSVLREPGYLTRQIDAHRDAGIRGVLAVQIEGGGARGADAWDDFVAAVEYIRAGDRSLFLDAAVYGAAQWAVDESLAALEVEAMRRFGLVNQAHLLETAEQLDQQRAKFGWYRDAGALGPSMIFGHFVHPSAEIVEDCVRTGCAVSWQPVANGRLASGAADAQGLRWRGIRVGLGLDDQACSDVSDPWQNMRFGLYQARSTTRTAALMPADVLRMQTLGAAEVIGAADRVGSLAPGKFADFVVVDPRSPDMGPLHSPVDNYVLSSTLRNLREVYVGGRLVSRDGRSTSPLAAASVAEVHRRIPLSPPPAMPS